MDRLLTDEEIKGIVQNTPAGVYDYKAVAQAQDDLTASLVAQEIFKEMENYLVAVNYISPEAGSNPVHSIEVKDFEAIKSKWGGVE